VLCSGSVVSESSDVAIAEPDGNLQCLFVVCNYNKYLINFVSNCKHYIFWYYVVLSIMR